MPYVYILECADGSYYVGSTRNIDVRMEQHETGRGSRYTSGRLPVRLVYSLECETIDRAYGLEKRIQNWSRAKRRALIDGDMPALQAHARKQWR
ncbi:GIY-YIG nuclease family protein [Gordonia sp. OPL2]|uniref:GIY-YIG nuclease family protein n=1 Tax=Gordonia sp. OPL2 TaxID=2486274 RepID=UPI0016558BD8|nr:GIY-YIG nuclease family protein [Gordonia sp. OPL2]ROZ89326.1 GIY-YIG nuclease family protein [Gordonia sp. OPL2]